MKILNDSTSSPLRFVGDKDNCYGQFYNSKDGKYHLALSFPYRGRPSRYLCGDTGGNMSPSRNADNGRQVCAGCYTALITSSAKDE